MKKTAAWLMRRALEEIGVRRTFGIPGVHTIELYDELNDTDPQVTGRPPVELAAADPEKGAHTVALLNRIVGAAWKVLADEPRANALLLRGISFYHPLPTMEER